MPPLEKSEFMIDWTKSNDPYIRLKGISSLKDGWCGPDSRCFSSDHIERCRSICDAFTTEGISLFISPSTNAIHFYSDCGERENQLELVVERDCSINYCKETAPNYLIEGSIDATGCDFAHLISWVKP